MTDNEDQERPEQVTEPINDNEAANQAGRVDLEEEFKDVEPEHNDGELPEGNDN